MLSYGGKKRIKKEIEKLSRIANYTLFHGQNSIYFDDGLENVIYSG